MIQLMSQPRTHQTRKIIMASNNSSQSDTRMCMNAVAAIPDTECPDNTAICDSIAPLLVLNDMVKQWIRHGKINI